MNIYTDNNLLRFDRYVEELQQKPLLVFVLQHTLPRMVQACHAPRQALQNHPSGHLAGWATPWSTGTSSGNCREKETCMVRACHTPRQPFPNHPSGYFGRWATPWSAEEMLDGQHQRVDIPVLAKTAHNDLLQKRLEQDLY